jgi:predicted  nucleic acid-binding Zn-ribbon protein
MPLNNNIHEKIPALSFITGEKLRSSADHQYLSSKDNKDNKDSKDNKDGKDSYEYLFREIKKANERILSLSS